MAIGQANLSPRSTSPCMGTDSPILHLMAPLPITDPIHWMLVTEPLSLTATQFHRLSGREFGTVEVPIPAGTTLYFVAEPSKPGYYHILTRQKAQQGQQFECSCKRPGCEHKDDLLAALMGSVRKAGSSLKRTGKVVIV